MLSLRKHESWGLSNVLLLVLLTMGLFGRARAECLNAFDCDDDDNVPAPAPAPAPPGPAPAPPAPIPAPAPAPFTIFCPTDDGKDYSTSSGKKFTVRCQVHTVGESIAGSKISTVKTDNIIQCMDECAKTPGCKSVDFAARKGDHIIGNCDLYKDGGSSTSCSSKSNDCAWLLDPPNTSCMQPGGAGVKYSCPADDRKTYTTENGKNYMLKCNYQSPAAKPLKNTACTSMMDCAEQCSNEDASVICDWNENNCAMKQEYIEPFYAVGVNTWVDIDKTPGIEPCFEDYPDEGGVACSTDCPTAAGTIHDTTVGERFHIDCGRRHAVKAIHQEKIESFKDCVNACGALVACHSVDWNKYTKMCYFGQHHGEPQMLAAAYSSAHSLGCAGSCSKGSSCSKDVSGHTEL